MWDLSYCIRHKIDYTPVTFRHLLYCPSRQLSHCEGLNFTRVHVHIGQTVLLFIVHGLHVSRWTTFDGKGVIFCHESYYDWCSATRVVVEKCRTVLLFAVHASRLTNVVLYKLLSLMSQLWRCRTVQNLWYVSSISTCRTVQSFNVYVYLFRCVILFMISWYTCRSWHVPFCTNVYCASVYVDTCRIFQTFIVHVSTLTSFVLYKIPLYTCLRWHLLWCKRFFYTWPR